MSASCGVVSDNAPCKCPHRLPSAVHSGRVVRGLCVYTRDCGPDYQQALDQARRVEGELRILRAQQATPRFSCPRDLATSIASIVEVG